MIRKIAKKKSNNSKLDQIIVKYNIQRAYLSINRKSVSKAMAVGLFIGMIPMPFQMVAVLFFIPFVKFNVPIGVSLVWITNPFTMPFIYYVEYITGNFLTFNHSIQHVSMTLEWFESNINNIAVPLYIGALFYSILFSVVGYFGVNYLWMYSVCKENKSKGKLPLKEKMRKSL